MKRTVSVVLLTIWLLSCMACQPTPEEEIVNNRADGALAKAIDAKPVEPYTLETTEKWEETFEVRDQPVKVDAEVLVPDTDTYPVVTIAEKDLTEEDAADFFKALFGEQVEVRQQLRSYDELLEDILLAERGRYRGEDEDTGEILYERDEEEIAGLKDLLAETPTENTY